MKVAFAGMSHLGVCMSIAAHGWGVDVLGFDVDAQRANRVASGDFDAAEPGVVEFLTSPPARFRITTDPAELAGVDLVMVTVDTVLDDSGENDTHEVVELIQTAASHVERHVPIVVASQVRPGFTRSHSYLHPELHYFMETLIFGRGLDRASRPERYIVGCADPTRSLPRAWADYLAVAGCPIHVMSYESAELTKLSANFILAANITAANSLADLAARLGANWQHIEAALRDDQRIGQKAYISAGLGIGGANLSRDLHGIRDMANRLGADAHLAETMLHHSDYMRNWVLRVITDIRQRGQLTRLTVLGLAYKPGTQSMRGGAGIDLVNLLGSSVTVVVHDPEVILPDPSALAMVSQARTVDQSLSGSDVIAITTPYPAYREALRKHIATSAGTIVVDPYRVVDPSWAAGTSTTLVQLGVVND